MHGKRRVLARRGRAGEKGDFFSILLKSPLGDLIQLIEVDRIESALCRLSRLAAFGKELDGTILSLLLALKQSRGWIDLDERDAFRNGKGHDR
jgi:hypothetical protein